MVGYQMIIAPLGSPTNPAVISHCLYLILPPVTVARLARYTFKGHYRALIVEFKLISLLYTYKVNIRKLLIIVGSDLT